MKIIKQLSFFSLSLILVGMIGVLAYDNLVIHPKLTRAALQVYHDYSENHLNSEQERSVVYGSMAEDTDPRYLHHYYNPTTGLGLKGLFSSAKDWAKNQDSVSGDYSAPMILANYQQGNIRRAYEGVGHILHLIQDMSVPAHTRDDQHAAGDPFEDWAKNFGQIDLGQVEFQPVDNLDQVFDDLALYSHHNFFSKDSVGINNKDSYKNFYETIDGKKRLYLIKNIDNQDYKIAYSKNPDSIIPVFQVDGDALVHQDYWKMLYPKAVGYSAGVIDYFQKEFAKIDEAKVQEKLSWWGKIKHSLSGLVGESKYSVGDFLFLTRLAFGSVFNQGEAAALAEIQELIPALPVLAQLSEIKDLFDNSSHEEAPPAEEIPSVEKIKISYVIDGDTFVLENGEKVRYIGVDTPELGNPGPDDDECLAWVARLRNMQLLGQGEITLVKDPEVDKDKYGRLLRYVYAGDIFINAVLAREGLAETFFCQPGWENCPVISDKAKEDLILQASQEAQYAERGIFGSACREDEKESLTNINPEIFWEGEQPSTNQNNSGLQLIDGKKESGNFFFSSGTSDGGKLNTFITAYPDLISSSSQANFTFLASEEGAGFHCSLDGAFWAACETNSAWQDLADGLHNLKVRAFLNERIDDTPASFNWLIDTVAPTSSIGVLNEEYEELGFSVSWQGVDPGGVAASGLAGFSVEYQEEGGEWQNWIMATTSLTANFQTEVEREQNICFRARAFDAAGNYEVWGEADACTYLVDSEMPKLDFFNLESLTSSSTAYTASTTVGLDYNLSNQEFVEAYLLSHSSSTPATDNAGWATSTPEYFVLSDGEGEKEIYFFVKHHGGEIALLGSAGIILDLTAPDAPEVSNIIPHEGIYWTATTTALLAGEKEASVNKIFINGEEFVLSSGVEWNLMHEFGFTGNGLLGEFFIASVDFKICAMMIPEVEFQQEILALQFQDEAGNFSLISSTTWQMDVYDPSQPFFDALSGDAGGNVFFAAASWDEREGGSGIKNYEFFYQEVGEEDWSDLLVSSWDDGTYKFRAKFEAGEYLVRVRAVDRAGNTGPWSSEKEVSVTPHLVLSEIYGGGGNAGSYWQNDFIEIYNPTAEEVSLAGWSVQYASAFGASWQITELSGSIAPYGFYLVGESQGAAGVEPLPAPDVAGSIAMSATAGKIALAASTTAISGIGDLSVVDFVGYGSANEYEGSAPASAPSNTKSIERLAWRDAVAADMASGGEAEFKGNGWDENDNSSDWVLRSSPEPQNTATSPEELGN